MAMWPENETQTHPDPAQVTAALDRIYAVESSVLDRAVLYAQLALLEKVEANDELKRIE